MKRFVKYVFYSLILVLVLLPVAIAGIIWNSNPKHQSEKVLKGLKKPVKVFYDNKGVPTINAESMEDLLFMQGYAVARDRLFQMDLLRRQTSGRLAEIIGEKALAIDKTMRFYGLEKVADKAYENMLPERKDRLVAYARGVNAFISEGPNPWETFLLGYKVEEWKPRDTILVALNLYNTLNHPTNEVEFSWGLLYEKLPKEVVDFLTPEHGFFDAPMVREEVIPPLPKVPGSEVFNLRTKTASIPAFKFSETRSLTGSNAWALSGTKTKSGIPLLSGDPHIRHMVPNIWYRQELMTKGFYAVGVSFPGIPGIVIGSNKNTAWSFTTPAVDNVDFIPLERGSAANTYMAYGKEVAFQMRSETFKIKNKDTVSETIRETVWGPAKEFKGKQYALQWAARDPEVLKELDVVEMNKSSTVEEAFLAMKLWAGPPQNFIVADKAGHIGWALVGHIPKKVGMDGRIPATRDELHDWKGYYDFSEVPKLIDPVEGFLASGNQRQVPIDEKTYQWGSNWMLPPRAYRIEEVLKEAKDWTVENMHTLQNDVLSHTHLWYRDRLQEALAKSVESSKDIVVRDAIDKLIKNFDGKIEVNSAAYPFLKKFRFEVLTELIGPFVSTFVPKDLEIDMMELLEKDTPVKVLLTEQPMHLLPSKYENYDELLVKAAIRVSEQLVRTPTDLPKLRWGDENHAIARHPLSSVMPKFISHYLDMPESELSGDELVPRVNKPNHGASIRINVDLSDFEKSLFSHPGGQSGHFLSQNYRDQFADWVEGKATNLVPKEKASIESFLP